MNFIILSMAFASVSVFAADAPTTQDCANEARFSEISKSDLEAKINEKKVFVIDVNGKSSFAEKHIPTAIHFGTHEKTLAKELPSDKGMLVVAYCGGPSCGAWKKAAQAACKQGYTNVMHFKGGLSGWFKS